MLAVTTPNHIVHGPPPGGGQLTDLRAARVARLKREVQRAAYEVDAGRVADALIARMGVAGSRS
jgi:Anti-sigma-28 factor, FlgM